MTHAQITASLLISFVPSVEIHPPSFLNVRTLSFLGKYGFLTLPVAHSDTNPYVMKGTLQGENGKRNHMCCLDKRRDHYII